MNRKLKLSWIGICTVVYCSGCTPNGQNTATTAGLQVSEAGRVNTGVHMDRYPFPTGAQISARTDIAGTLRHVANVAAAVVIESDRQVYVAVRTYAASLSPSQQEDIVQEVRQFDANAQRVFVTSKPDAFADFQNYERYLKSGRTVSGMLLSWRSIVRKTWGTNNLSGS
jgi:hypothetical protein